MALSQKSVSFLLLGLLCVSVCCASRSTFGDDDPKKTNAQTQETTGRSTFGDDDPKKTNAHTQETTGRSTPNDDKKNNAQTQVTTSAVSTYGGYSYTSGSCGSSSCTNGGGGGSMSGCGHSCSNGGGACLSGDSSPQPCQMPSPPCQMPVHCTPQCQNVQPMQSPCTPQYPQPQPQPCSTCNQQPHCLNNDCGNGGYSGIGSIGTDSKDPYYEKDDSEPKTKKPDGDGAN